MSDARRLRHLRTERAVRDAERDRSTKRKRSMCPECAQGKHSNCDGQAWDFEADVPEECGCPHE